MANSVCCQSKAPIFSVYFLKEVFPVYQFLFIRKDCLGELLLVVVVFFFSSSSSSSSSSSQNDIVKQGFIGNPCS